MTVLRPVQPDRWRGRTTGSARARWKTSTSRTCRSTRSTTTRRPLCSSVAKLPKSLFLKESQAGSAAVNSQPAALPATARKVGLRRLVGHGHIQATPSTPSMGPGPPFEVLLPRPSAGQADGPVSRYVAQAHGRPVHRLRGWEAVRLVVIVLNCLPCRLDLAKILDPDHTDRVAEWSGEIMLTIDREMRLEHDEHRVHNERFE